MRRFSKWESNSRFIKMVDMTAECNKLGLNYGPPHHAPQAGLWQDPTAQYHGGCPLAEIWVTSFDPEPEAPAPSAGRALESNSTALLADEPSAELRQGEESISVDLKREESISVARAQSFVRSSTNFRFTNGQRPFFVGADGSKEYDRSFVESYAGLLSVRRKDVICRGAHSPAHSPCTLLLACIQCTHHGAVHCVWHRCVGTWTRSSALISTCAAGSLSQHTC